MKTLKVLDLFAGGGGFSQGFSMAEFEGYKFEILRALELDEDACETLNHHLGKEKVIQGDITDKTIKKKLLSTCNDIDVIIGGPPCQTFSLAGPARSGTKDMREKLKNDPRNTLYKHFFEIVEMLTPNFVVFENVEGMLSKKVDSIDDLNKKQIQIIELICDELEELGYHTSVQDDLDKRYQLLNSAHFGVPQYRKRIIIIANRFGMVNPVPQMNKDKVVSLKNTISKLPVRLPEINLSGMEKLKNIDVIIKNFNKSITIFMNGIGTLAEQEILKKQGNQKLLELFKILNYRYHDIKNKKTYKFYALRQFIEFYNNQIESLGINKYKETKFNKSHQSRKHNFRDIIIFMSTKQGSNSSKFMDPDSNDYKKFLSDLYPYARNKHKDTYVKHSWDRPSNTILAHMQKDGLKFIHPDQPRTFTPYEAALLQSFPSRYKFCGGRNAQYRQIGNAVPPLMAKAIGESVLKIKTNHDRNLTRTTYELA